MSALHKLWLDFSGPSLPTADTPEGGDFAIMDGGTNVLAEVFHRLSEDRTQDAEALARLFAAAPELLASLQMAEQALNKIRVCCHHTAWDSTGPAVTAARAAIAKATGVAQ